MNAQMKMLLNISGITKRNYDLSFVCVGKVCGNTLILRIVYPLISTVQPFDTLTTSQKLILWLRHYAFISFSIPTG
jgi:hypothetical protein